jgi:Pyruvate/2-oxoacid:ferredoxin oxidoreductase delta subunit
MSEEIYLKLRKQLDQYSLGFPETKSGVEIKILQKLFTEDEAAMYLDLTMQLEAPESAAERTGRDPQEIADLLETMAKKGLIFRLRREGKVRYGAAPFVIGSYEYQLKNMDKEFAELIETYMNEGFLDVAKDDIIMPLRTIPVNKSLDVSWQVAPYDDAKEIIKKKDKISVADCICRVQQGHLEDGCDKPKEVCLAFGSHADFYVENGLGRYITQEEALKVLDECEKAGLVNQPASMVNPGGMCNCCGDCCGLLRSLNRLPNPSERVLSSYYAVSDQELCTGCEECLDRCQMAAITMSGDETAVINTDRCIGCGLCVTTCPVEAITLTIKPEETRGKPMESGQELMMKTAEARGTSLIPLSMLEKK